MKKDTPRYSDFSPAALRRLWTLFALALLGALVAELFIHPHPTFNIEGTPFFNAWYGFAACATIVIVSNLLGKLLKRKEDYYKGGPHE